MIDVFQLGTDRKLTYDTNDPITAVRMAYAQYVNRDFNTWDYGTTLPKLPYTEGRVTVACGDFCAFKIQLVEA